MIINQLRRNVFNLDLKREIVAAKTNVKHFFLFNSHLAKYGTNWTWHNLADFLNMCILLRLPGRDKAINSTLKKAFFNLFESLFYRSIDQDSVNKLCITNHDSLARFLKTRQLCYLFCQLHGSNKIANNSIV